MASNDELDRRIDNALAGYAGAEPLAGIEERVVRRVRVASRRRAFGWAAAIAVAAGLVAAVIVVRAPQHAMPKSNVIARVETVSPPRPVPVAEKPRVVPVHRVKSRVLRPGPLPKQEQFPAPTPLTAEERALLALVEHHPAEAQHVFAELQKSGEPIEIQPIQIPPLQSDGAQ
jgi:hypothetical protein